ncbi:MAG: His/Gly/Thr/Pro-type tRNA ligase C-terminal domain-containing protein [Microthrixaceae bacterium]
MRGTMVIRPYAYAIREHMQAEVDALAWKATGAENAYFPLFIPEEYLQRARPTTSWLQPRAGGRHARRGNELEHPVVVRPTSETVIGEFMSKWIQSHRDLPMLLNQWSNVVRWEKRPRIFLRTSEFLWQEGHTAHASEEEANRYAVRILHEVYADFMEEHLAIPVIRGRKIPHERFPGATNTMTVESMMRDGKALQMGTSHELGQNFAKAFDIGYQGADGERSLAWTTSWGVTTRMLGGLIMTHGDDAGLRVPPKVAGTQVAVMVVRDDDAERVSRAARYLAGDLVGAGIRTRLDDNVDTGFGRRATAWELKGVPVRIEMGPRDLDEGVAVVVRRDTGEKTPVPTGEVAARVAELLDEIQQALFDEALEFQRSHTADVSTVAEAIEAGATGFARLPWSEVGDAGVDELGKHAITVRCLVDADGGVADSDDGEGLIAVVGRSY